MFRQTNADYTHVTYPANKNQIHHGIPSLKVWPACLDRIGVGRIKRELRLIGGSGRTRCALFFIILFVI